jgi:hypothetical protein
MRLVAAHDPGPGGYPDGAPPGFSGGFREDSCHACHFLETPNAAPGNLTVEGVPATFSPGQRYTVTITLTRDGMKRAGFQLAARFKDNGAQAGILLTNSSEAARVKVETQGGVLYAGHNTIGSEIAEAGIARWSVDWEAPATGGAVVLNVAANAADGDERVDGDFVYTVALETAPSLADDSSVEQMEVTLRVTDPSRIVRHHHHRGAVAVQLAEHLAQGIAGL